MAESLFQQAEALKNEAIEFIQTALLCRVSGRKVFKNLKDISYCMDNGGYSCDQLGCITYDEEIYFVEEGSEFGINYDFEEDEDCIVVGTYYGFAQTLTYQGLFDLADALDRTKKAKFSQRFKEIEKRALDVINSIDGEVEIFPTLVILDIDCHWFSTNAVSVTKVGFTDENGNDYPFDNVDGSGTSVCIDEIIKLADEVNMYS